MYTHIYIMAKTIAVSDETYELLKSSKGEDESFSELIKRSLKKRSKLVNVIGSNTISKDDWKKIKKVIEKAEVETEKGILARS